MTTSLIAAPVTDYAIIVDPKDNVAVVKKETAPGLEVVLPDGREIRVNRDDYSRTSFCYP